MILKWFKKRKERYIKKLYKDGYDAAAGFLLRKEKSPMELTIMIDYGDYNPYVKGWHDAIEDLIALGVVKDNRV